MSELLPISHLPRHIAIIMDGNNRWAKANKLKAVAAGHSAGVESIRDILEACQQAGVEILTLFAFSSENWQRPKSEVDALMKLFSRYLETEVETLQRNDTRIRFIGDRHRFSPKLQRQMEEAEDETASNSSGTLVIAADYGGRWDIAQAAAQLAADVASGVLAAEEINEHSLGERVCLADLPPPDLLVRTGGDHRISNFLLWQCAYTELYFTEKYWPDFKPADLYAAIDEFKRRERRFGKTSEQMGSFVAVDQDGARHA